MTNIMFAEKYKSLYKLRYQRLRDTVITAPSNGRKVDVSSILNDWFMSRLKSKFWKNLHIKTLASICQYTKHTQNDINFQSANNIVHNMHNRLNIKTID